MKSNLRRISLGANLIKKNHIMKKLFVTFVLVVVSLVSALATETFKVKYVSIGSFDRGTEVICTNGKCFYSTRQRQFTSFFNSLRAGDIIEVEEYENNIMAIRKVGYEAPEGMTNGVIIPSNSYGYGTYGGVYGGAGAAVIETKNFGVSYDSYTGVNVRIGNGEKGFGAVNIPIRLKSKKARRTESAETVNATVTANPAVKVVSVDELAKAGNVNNVVKTAARTNTTKTTTTRSNTASKVYTASGVVMF